ncbi:MAG: polyisoprenoid-binding protein [Nevskia sp.]|nr:polyisoprenoid-binding protein [Nevskia sp.]
MRLKPLAAASLLALSVPAFAEVEHYTVDPDHTYVSMEVPHIQGISIWRGKFDHTQSGAITLDRARKTGTVDVVIDAASIDFGHKKLNEELLEEKFFDTKKYPTATYHADSIKFDGDSPAEVNGQLTLHGVTKPVALKINSFKCIMHPMLKVQVCGADASAEFDRSDFGIAYGVQFTGTGKVKLQIQVEAELDSKPGPQH